MHTKRMIQLAVSAAMLATALPASAQDGGQDKPGPVERAATSPLRDTRIRNDKIPEILLLAASAPYSMRGMTGCRAIAAEVDRLTVALGVDADRPAKKKGESAEIAAGATRAVVTTIIPGLGLVRLVTGADKAQRRVEAAVYAGSVRRGFLKGVGLARGCKPPAAPLSAAVADIQELPADLDNDGKPDRPKDEK